MRALGVAALACSLIGCEGEVSSPLKLELSSSAPSCAKGRSVRLYLYGVYPSGMRVGLNSDAVWSSSAPDVGDVSNEAGRRGIFRCHAPGAARVTAAVGELSAEVDLTVEPAALEALELPPEASAMLPAGTSRTLSATGRYTDGSRRDLTAEVSWSSSDPSTLTVAAGVVTAIVPGHARVEARRGEVVGAIEIPTGAPLLARLNAALAQPAVPIGAPVTVSLTGVYTDGSARDMLAEATWSSSNPAVLEAGAGGAVGRSVGQARLTATVTGISTALDVTVVPAAVVSLRLSPSNPDFAAGMLGQLTVRGTYTDRSERDLTALAHWTSSSHSVLLPDPGGVPGMFWAVGAGAATVTAQLDGVEGSLPVTVGPARLVELVLSPASASLPRTSVQQYTATGVYTDQSRSDFTEQVTWSSSDPSIVSIDAQGRATAHALGSCTIRAAYQGKNPFTSVTVVQAALVALEVSPANASLAKGRTQAFTALGRYADGSQRDLTSQVTWSSTDPGVALISNAAPTQGLARTFSTGNVTLVATLAGTTGSATLAVGPAVLDQVQLNAPARSLAKGTRMRLQATAVYSDSTTQDVTELAGWSSSAPHLAAVSAQPGARGEVTGLAEGAADVTAQYAGQAPMLGLTVTAAQLVSIALSPPNASMPKGTSRAYQAVGVYTDGSSQDLTAQVAWSAGSGAVTVSNAAPSAGQVAAAHVGSAQLFAALAGVTGQTSVQVTAAELTSLVVAPATASGPAGTSVQLTATGSYTDGSSQDLTAQVAWSTAASNLSVGPSGRVRIDAQGPAADVTASLGGFAASAQVVGTAARLDTLTISPLNASIAQGTTRQFTATGTYSDATVADLTTSVIWASSDPSVVAISNAQGSQGLASALAAGSVTVSAQKDGLIASTPLTVQPGTIVSVELVASSFSAPKGTLKQFFAQATLSDGSTQDVTAQATWASSEQGVATVSNASGSRGLVTAVDVGSVTLSATVGGQTGQANFTVTPPALTSISLTPQNPSIAIGGSVQLTAFGTYTDNSTADVTNSVLWSSSNAGVASASNAQGSQGLISGISSGQATIQATLSGRTATTAVTVTPP